jgi:hypothetical protein
LFLAWIALAPCAFASYANFYVVGIGATNAPIRFSSPVLVDLDRNPRTLEIVVGDEYGYIYGFNCLGQQMWQFSIRQFAGFEWVWTACQSAPAVADLDHDGRMEVVVTLASRDEYIWYKPGAFFMFRLDRNGYCPTAYGGFAGLTCDVTGDNVSEGCFASPMLADLDGDRDLEVLIGSWDHTVYALHHTGAPAWYLNYDLSDGYEYGFKTGDTVWDTPAVADLDGDGYSEVVFGVDTHDFAWGHQIPFMSRAGGILVVLNAWDGTLKKAPWGWGRFFVENYTPEGSDWYYNANGDNHIPAVNISQVLQSSPIVADVDGDGKMEVVHGTGQNYYAPTDIWHNRLFCWNGETASLQWAPDVGAEVFASPAAANVDGDPQLEVFVRNFSENTPALIGLDGAYGTNQPGFPAALRPGNPRSIGSVIGDVDGDGMMEIITVSYGRLHVFGANGVQESYFDSAPGCMFSSPAIGDIDGDGRCEMVLSTSYGVIIYRCNGTAGAMPWPQYRRDARHSGTVPLFEAQPVALQALSTARAGQPLTVRLWCYNTGSFVWSSNSIYLKCMSAQWSPATIGVPAYTYVMGSGLLMVDFTLTAPRKAGYYLLPVCLTSFTGVEFGWQVIGVVVN